MKKKKILAMLSRKLLYEVISGASVYFVIVLGGTILEILYTKTPGILV